MVRRPWFSPLLDAPAMRAADQWAIGERGIPSLELMETAGGAVAEIAAEIAEPGPVRVICGKGNNGGDGIVAARHLLGLGYEVEPLLLWPASELSADATTNLERLGIEPRVPAPAELEPLLCDSGVIVDAIFGTGFSGAPREPAKAAIEAINAAGRPVLACDIASGVDASTGETEGAAVRASATVSFHAAKIGHRIAPGSECTGRLHVVDIGIPADAPVEAPAGTIEPAILETAPRRGARSNKFSSGNVLIVGGSRGLTGAVCMAAEAAIRAGAGYAAAAVPAGLEPILEVKLTEVMTLGVAERDGGLAPAAAAQILERAGSARCVVLGPGLGGSEAARELALELAAAIEAPLLIDADGLGALGAKPERAAREGRDLILTPHAGELARLLETDSEAIGAARLRSACELARRAGAIVVLKGADTIVTDGERIVVNALPSPGLATAGTGDVLSGVIAALLARGMAPFEAAAAGVLAHARAGRLAADRLGAESVIAGDVIAELPAGLRP